MDWLPSQSARIGTGKITTDYDFRSFLASDAHVRVVVFGAGSFFAFRGKAFTSKIGIRAREFVPRL